MRPSKFGSFNLCRCMAEKATHDLDYKAQLERSAYDYNQSIELDELNIEVEKSMTALLKRHHGHEGLVWRKFGGWANYDDERVERDSDHAEWVDKYEGWYTGTASTSARRALTLLAAGQRIHSDPRPFHFMKLPPEIRQQVYRELFIGGGRTIVVFKDSEPAFWAQSCQIEGAGAFGKDITTALLRINRRIYDEALPVLYQSHAFDFGIDVHNIAPFFNKTSFAARQNIGCVHMELLRYGIAHPLRSVPERGLTKDTGLAWGSACAYIASHLLVRELSLNIDFAIPHDFQRFHWVVDLAQIRSRKVVHHNSPNKHALKAEKTPYVPRDNDWGTDEHRWEAVLGYLRPKMLL